MFKKLKEKITENSPQRFQQLTQSVSEILQPSASADENFFSIGEDDANVSANSADAGFSSVTLVSPSDNRFRRNSNSSLASDVSFLPRYESSANMYQLQSDLDVSASEVEDNASSSSQLGHLSKEQIYSAFQKAQMRYHKYRGRYTDLAKHYKELERENGKMKSVLVETQDKAIRRVKELKEQCALEQKAKAHLEGALRDELDEREFKIQTLQTKIGLLSGNTTEQLVNVESSEPTNESLDVLTKYLNDARKEIESLNEKLQEYKANSIVFQSKEQEYKSKVAKLEKEMAQFSEREKENNLKLAQSKMELHNEILSKDAEILNMKKDNEVLRQSLEAFENQSQGVKMENLQIQNKKLIERVESLTQKCNNLESELLKVEQYKIEIKKLKEEAGKLVELKEGLKGFKEQVQVLVQEKTALADSIVVEKEEYEKQILEIRDQAKQGLISLEGKIREKIVKEFQEKEESLKEEYTRRLEELNTNGVNLKETQLKIIDKEEIINSLSKELDVLKKEVEANKCQYKDLEENHLALIEDSSKSRNEISNLEKELANIKNDSLDYTEKISRLQASINTLQSDLEEARDYLKQKDLEAIQLNTDKTHLEEKIRLMEQRMELDAIETTECSLLEMKLQKYEEQNKELTENLAKESKNVCILTEDLKKLKEESMKNEEMLEELKQTTFEKTNLEDLIRNLEEEKVKIVEDFEAERKRFEETFEKNTKNEERLEKLLEENIKVSQSANATKEEVDKLNETIKNKSEENKQLQKENSNYVKNINELTNQLESFKTVQTTLEDDVRKRDAEVEDLKKNIDKLSGVIKNQSEEFTNLLNRSNQLDVVVEKIQAESANSLKKEKEIQAELIERIKNCEDDVVRKKEELLKLQTQLNELENAAIVSKEKLKSIEDEKVVLQTNLEAIEEEATRLKIVETNYNLLEAKLNESESEIVEVRGRLTESLEKARLEISELNLRLQQISSDNNHIVDENQHLTNQVEELKVKNEFLESEKNKTKQVDLQNDFYEVKIKCDNLFIENKTLKSEIQSLENKCDDFVKTKKAYESQISELEHQYNELLHEKQLLQDEVQELKISPINLQNNTTKLDNLEIIKQEKAFKTDAANNNEKYIKEIDSLRDKLTQYKSLDLTNKTSIEFYETELQKMKNKNEKLSRKLDETLVTLNHCTDLNGSTEIEYLKNVLYNYMLGKESLVMARVIAAVCKFDPQQTETVIQKEQQKQTLLGQLGIL